MTTTRIKGAPAPALAQVLEAVAMRRSRLDALDTQITDLIKRIEETLRLHLAVRICTDMSRSHDVCETLVFGKHDGKWQLFIEVEYGSNSDTTPLTSCTRETRTTVFTDGHVEQLIRDAQDQLDAQIREREKAVTLASGIADTLLLSVNVGGAK